MIVYQATREAFTRDVLTNQIESVIGKAFEHRLGHRTSPAEITSWKNSMRYMNDALLLANAPGDAGVAIEYRVPLTSKRVDFILTGTDEENRDTAVIVELKQWSALETTGKDAIVRTWVGKGHREVTHPSYQAWTYATLMRDFNVAVQEGDIRLAPCAYLHNLETGEAINDMRYAEHTSLAPSFIRNDVELLADFLSRHVRQGDRNRLLYRLEEGRLRPSKSLANELVSLMHGKPEFMLIDEQKLVYETALALAERSVEEDRRHVLIVRGGPGTGKTVVAINLLVELTRRERVAQYVSRNAAPRAVYSAKLKGAMTKTRIDNLFKGSGGYVAATPKAIDTLIVDEAHRLNEKSGLYGNLGKNQIDELISASTFSVFFVDDAQRVTLKDIGESGEIRRRAIALDATVHELELASQFRCGGSDGYLAWLDDVLQLRQTANDVLDSTEYEFVVHETPGSLRDRVRELNLEKNRARMVAGYCWDWKGKKNPEIKDIVYPNHNFAARWNLDKDGSLWILQEHSVEEIGCIHTCQGLEVDHVGVLIGPDLIVRDGRIVTNGLARSSQDRSIHGFKGWLKRDPEAARAAVDTVIRNTYRTLMSRGLRSCSIYSEDKETREWFGQRSATTLPWPQDLAAEPSQSD